VRLSVSFQCRVGGSARQRVTQVFPATHLFENRWRSHREVVDLSREEMDTLALRLQFLTLTLKLDDVTQSDRTVTQMRDDYVSSDFPITLTHCSLRSILVRTADGVLPNCPLDFLVL